MDSISRSISNISYILVVYCSNPQSTRISSWDRYTILYGLWIKDDPERTMVRLSEWTNHDRMVEVYGWYGKLWLGEIAVG